MRYGRSLSKLLDKSIGSLALVTFPMLYEGSALLILAVLSLRMVRVIAFGCSFAGLCLLLPIDFARVEARIRE